jgi:hypothetical protein
MRRRRIEALQDESDCADKAYDLRVLIQFSFVRRGMAIEPTS